MPDRYQLKILQINTADRGGGAEGSAWNLFQSYKKLGHKSWLAVGYKYSDDSDVYSLDSFSYRCSKINLWSAAWLSLGNHIRPYFGRVGGIGRILKYCRYIGNPNIFLDNLKGVENFNFSKTSDILNQIPASPDIIHCHNLHGNYFNLESLPYFSNIIPVIINLRDAWLLSGHCAHSLGCDRWVTGCGKCPDLNIHPKVRKDSTAFNWTQKKKIYDKSQLYVTTPSKWLMDKVSRSMLNYADARVIPNGIDISVFTPGDRVLARQNLSLSKAAKVVLFTAHNNFKNSEVMENALNLIDINKGNKNLVFICLGKTGKSRRLGNGQIKFVGFEKNINKLVDYYRSADVYIHAAKAEAFGKTVTEAMACGTPVVATMTGGVSEQIIDGQTGYLVSSDDVCGMATRVSSLLEDENGNKGISTTALEEVRKRFSLETQSAAFIDWYYEIIEKRRILYK